MQLRYITCSDPREHNSFDELFDLWNMNNRIEIAVQMHPGKVSPGTDRYKWVNELVNDKLLFNFYRCNFAIHINLDWCDDICNGKIPDALMPLFQANQLYRPLVQRIQLNMPQYTADSFDANKLKRVIDAFPDKEFILQYNNRTKNAVEKLSKTDARFSLLYDASGGCGIETEQIQSPFIKKSTGYSGGFSPENISDKLDKIASVSGNRNDIWIDAEGKLKDANKKFDIARAKQYINNALQWQQNQK